MDGHGRTQRSLHGLSGHTTGGGRGISDQVGAIPLVNGNCGQPGRERSGKLDAKKGAGGRDFGRNGGKSRLNLLEQDRSSGQRYRRGIRVGAAHATTFATGALGARFGSRDGVAAGCSLHPGEQRSKDYGKNGFQRA